MFFSCCSYSLIYIYKNHLYILLSLALLFYFLFSCHPSLAFFLISFLFLSFLSLFLFSSCLLICFVFFALFPSWHSALAQFSGLSFISSVFNWSISFLLSLLTKSISCTFFPLEYFPYLCVYIPLLLYLYVRSCIYHLSGFILCFLLCFDFCLHVFALVPFNTIVSRVLVS